MAKKTHFGPDLGPLGQNLSRQFFFFFLMRLRQSLDVMVSYHHVQFQKKLIIQSSENLVADRRADGQTDGQIDGRE